MKPPPQVNPRSFLPRARRSEIRTELKADR
jgi:hypothetical protein